MTTPTPEPTDPAPIDPASTATALTDDAPEAPQHLWHYPIYTLRLMRHRRRIRQRMEALDRDLREAVQVRDEALALLGEATLSGGAGGVGGRITAFAETLARLDAERATIDRRREASTIELAAAEADRRARLAEFDARLEGLEAELAPLERALVEHVERRDALEHEGEDAADLRRSLELRLAHIEDDFDGADEAARQLYEAERPEIEQKLVELRAADPIRAAARAAIDGPLARLDDQVAELKRMQETVSGQRESWLEEVDGRIAELTASREDELEALARSDVRRRAALVDLGREALHLDGGESPGEDARRALDHIVGLRRARRALQAHDAALDTGPLRITLALIAALGIGLLFLRGC